MRTNVSIKFNSIEEYRETENKLIELGHEFNGFKVGNKGYISLFNNNLFGYSESPSKVIIKTYNSLEEFLKD